MASKKINLFGRQFDIEGVGIDDPYFVGLSDHTDGDLSNIIKVLLAHDSVALDIGANIGFTSLMLSQHLRVGKVFSFEPSPSVFPILSRNLSFNTVPNMMARQIAVGEKQGELGFAGESAYGHLVVGEEKKTGDEGIKVTVEKLDEIVESLALGRLDFVKIDVEGFEADVLSGGKKTEARFKPLYFVEFNGFCISAFREMNPLEFANRLLTDFEYVFHVSTQGALSRMSADDAVHLVHRNIVEDGGVSNLLLTNSEERLKPQNLSSVMTLTKQIADVTAERDNAAAERDNAAAERDNAAAERDHARRYPWKYLSSALTDRKRKR